MERLIAFECVKQMIYSVAQMAGVLVMAAGLAQDGTDQLTGTLWI